VGANPGSKLDDAERRGIPVLRIETDDDFEALVEQGMDGAV
jgi:hypothetical protein